MNYYRRYVGDYLRDTARLSLLDHGAYNLLLDYYYADERPLPSDRNELYLMVRAMTPADRKSVDKILGLYFTLDDDGFHQKRVDHEIEVSKKARDNGKKHTGSTTGSVTGLITDKATGEITGLSTKVPTGSVHPPTTNHQPPPSNRQPPEKSNVGLDARRILVFLNEKAQRRYQANRVNLGFIVARLNDGATETECRQVIAKKTREWGNDPKMCEYLRPATLFNATKFSQYQGELIAPTADVSRGTSGHEAAT